MTLKYSPIVEPKDKVVVLYNELWLNIRETKNTLSKWISNIFDKCEDNLRLIAHNDIVIGKLGDCYENVENRIDDIESKMEDFNNEMEYFKNEMMTELREELREELMREIREEMRA